MVDEIYADAVGRVDFIGGMIRMELVSLEPAGDGNARMEVRHRVVMPLDGFLRSAGTANDLIQKLIDAGIVKREARAGADKKG